MNFLQYRTYGIALMLVGAGACGDDGTTTQTTTTTTPMTAGSSSGGETPTSGGPETTAGTSQAATSEVSASSTGSVTTATTTTDGESTAGATSAGETTTGADTGETGGSSGETGSEPVVPCVQDEDCTLVDDCCSCEPIGPGEEAPACDLPECFVTQCQPKGLGGAELACRFGRCTFVKVDCNPVNVICKSEPPDCTGTEVPSVDVDAACWTGQCVPAEACDWVPDCSHCDEDELICVTKLQKGSFAVCEPKPVDCGDSDNIDCTCGQQVCDASPPHTICMDLPDDIACECPVC